MFSRHVVSGFGLIFVLFIAGIFSLAPVPALAQEEGAPYELMIGAGGEAAPDIPDYTVGITVFNSDQSEVLGNCTLSITSKPNGCSLEVPAGTEIVAVVDEATLPAGIAPVENAIVYMTPLEREGLGDFTFEFVYADGGNEDADEVDQLPATGSGPEPATHERSVPLMVIAGSLLVLASASARAGRILRR